MGTGTEVEGLGAWLFLAALLAVGVRALRYALERRQIEREGQ